MEVTKYVELSDVRWMAIRKGDLPSDGTIDLAGGRLRCASPQGLCYLPGTIEEANHLAALLLKIGKGIPTSEDVKKALHRSTRQYTHYEYEEKSGIWFLRCVTASPNPMVSIQSSDWIILFDTGKGWLELPRLENPLPIILSLFPLLNGEHSKEDLFEFCTTHATPELAQIVKLLLDYNILKEVPKKSKSALEIPNFLFLGHAGFAVRVHHDIALFDPLMVPENTTIGDHRFPTILNAASAVFLSHCHWDHVHPQTIFRIPRHVKLYVPHCESPSLMNPSIAEYLRALGFECVLECSPGDVIHVGDIEVQFSEFFGEPFGLDSVFDGLTYTVRFLGRTIFGTVDALRNERDDMTQTIARIAATEPISIFMFGSSAQCHNPIYLAAGYRHFSNELMDRPDLHQYHPCARDVLNWVRMLKPSILIPYAQFHYAVSNASLYSWDQLHHLELDASVVLEMGRAGEDEWLRSLLWLQKESHTSVLWLQPGQGVVS